MIIYTAVLMIDPTPFNLLTISQYRHVYNTCSCLYTFSDNGIYFVIRIFFCSCKFPELFFEYCNVQKLIMDNSLRMQTYS